MSDLSGAPVVVGVDGSESALDAVRLAAREAERRGRALHVVHAFIWPLMHVPLGPDPAGPPEGGLRHAAERLVGTAVDMAAKTVPGLRVTSEIREGYAAPVLLHQARQAALVVLGDRGLGAVGGLIMGSVAVQVAAHAACPVLVAKRGGHPEGPVVVGVDGSEVSDHAVGFAFEEASQRGAPLRAVLAWRYPVSAGHGDMLPLVYDRNELAAEEEVVLAEATAGWRDRFPDVVVTRHLDRGRPADVLVRESRAAQLVVVGARGRGGFTGLLLGSVSHAVLHHAHCPIAIVHR
jgi:nucleotide-binding universal stress UspA family protein